MPDNGEKRVNERDQGMMGGEESWGSTKPQETKEEKISSSDVKCRTECDAYRGKEGSNLRKDQ